MTEDEMYRRVYDGAISLKEFKRWLNAQLSEAYSRGISDAQEDLTYDDVSKSQYDQYTPTVFCIQCQVTLLILGCLTFAPIGVIIMVQ